MMQGEDCAFIAGVELTKLDAIVAGNAEWLGVWRDRLAMEAAIAACKKAGRRESEDEIRSVVHFGSDDPNSRIATRLYLLWRSLSARSPEPWLDRYGLAREIWGTSLAVSGGVGNIVEAASRIIAQRRPGPMAAAEMFAATVESGNEFEVFGAWMADIVMAKVLKWPFVVPLFAIGASRAGWLCKFAALQGEAWRWEGPVAWIYAHAAARARELASKIEKSAAPIIKVVGEDQTRLRNVLDRDAVSWPNNALERSDEGEDGKILELIKEGSLRVLLKGRSETLYGL